MPPTQTAATQQKLMRSLGLGALVIYGIGDILGAGIYTIVGKIAGHAGEWAWVSFGIAMGIVLLTALSYSELVSRLPQSGGVSIYVQKAFGYPSLSLFTGFLLFGATILSMATLSHAFVGYLSAFGLKLPTWVGMFLFLSILLLINIRGIKQSSTTNIISTTIEVSGLLIVLACGFFYLMQPSHQDILPLNKTISISDILQGTALAFFAFTGFEDLVNVAEESKKPEKNIPRAILSSLGLAGILYLGVSWVSTAVLSGNELNQSDSPLLAVVTKAYPPIPVYLFSFIAIFAVTNTALLNYITASRLLYGMAEANLLPQFFQTVHKKFHTPYVSILMIFPVVLGLGLIGNLKTLASSTSALVLTIFSFSSLALIKIKLKHSQEKKLTLFKIPIWVPFLAIILNLFAGSFLPEESLVTAALVIGIVILIVIIHYLINRFRR